MTEENMDQGPGTAATPKPAPIMANIIELPKDELKLALHTVPTTVMVDPFKPKNLSEAMALAEMMAKSTIVPKDYIDKPGNCFIAMQWGFELGLPVLQAMQNIAIINGRPTLWGDAVLAIVRSAVDVAGNRVLEGISETFDETTMTATCSVKRRGAAQACVRTFSRADAVKAGLANRDTWKAYEKRMLQMRARSWALRDEFTDVLRGMPVAEEVMDYVAPEKDVTPLPTAAPVETKADRLKSKLKPDPVAGPSGVFTVADVVSKFDGAKTKDDLVEGVDLARGLKRPEDQALANTAYHRAKARILGPATETLESGGEAQGAVA
jgi:hypothetical protein